ncbi:MBOAT family O-acyltransferase [Anaerolactibacter massiliensis]|jgi:alginate O-acetyltransferase complex protein AlgI|uniref:MBOAT family O-acyltransferase n=1 Tax=Anaerolactibacter massiliensis TaxID=2044573 RepID=UPI000CF9A67B|nr:MBOAT family O-acyltransferase [Anaerolactibacter massiliensis]
MVFSSLTFLFAYLPIVLAVYYLVPMRWRNLVLLLVSLFFYGWGEPVYILVMIFSILMNWIFGNFISRYRDSDRKKAKHFLVGCIVVNLALLGFFKYWDFFASNLNHLGLSLPILRLSLPIGISFYTFQTMSYPIDLYRKQTDPQKSLVSFGAYVCMFPQLIAGPIVRYVDVAEQLDHRTLSRQSFYDGTRRFIVGLCKKVLLANNAGQVFETISHLPVCERSVLTAWLGIILYAFQIYFDFSGYSDMAIGLGKMLGFDFPENFNYPYISDSITEFWRRWHMTLSFWFRDYVYIPLGGNRHGLKRQLINIMIVWLLTGFWHGASWNFVLWGVYYGVILIMEKLFLLKWLKKSPGWVRHVYTIFVFLIGWVLFAFTDLNAIGGYLSSLFFASGVLADGRAWFYLRDNMVLLIVSTIACTPIAKTGWNILNTEKGEVLVPVLTVAGLAVCTAFIVDASYNPFLYFRF